MLPEEGASPPEVFRRLLKAAAPEWGLSISPSVLSALARYLAELDVRRRTTNLTGPLGFDELVSHTLESALGERLISHGARVVDIGSGAGFPGLPLAIVRPDLTVTLLEPRAKRAAFLRHVVRETRARNARVEESRATALPKQARFDVATSRAVGRIVEILRGASFLAPGGTFLAWTTEPQELARRLVPLFSLERTESVPGSQRRTIALFRGAL